jgi:hypothetical protein
VRPDRARVIGRAAGGRARDRRGQERVSQLMSHFCRKEVVGRDALIEDEGGKAGEVVLVEEGQKPVGRIALIRKDDLEGPRIVDCSERLSCGVTSIGDLAPVPFSSASMSVTRSRIESVVISGDGKDGGALSGNTSLFAAYVQSAMLSAFRRACTR